MYFFGYNRGGLVTTVRYRQGRCREFLVLMGGESVDMGVENELVLR